jgi:nucleoside-diphosphate-sugar epimerase
VEAERGDAAVGFAGPRCGEVFTAELARRVGVPRVEDGVLGHQAGAERRAAVGTGRLEAAGVQVRDIATAVTMSAAALPQQPAFTAYNVGSGTVRTIGDLATELAQLYNGPAPIVTGQYRLGDVRHITASSDRLKAELGWKPAYDLTAGLSDLLRGADLPVGQ